MGKYLLYSRHHKPTIIPANNCISCSFNSEASSAHDALSMGNQPRPQRTLGTTRTLLLLANTEDVVNPHEHHLTRD